MSLQKKMSERVNLQRLLVSLCILYVCVGTQRMQTVKWDAGIFEFARDSLGVLMAVILFTHYKWGDFVKYKIPYIVWSVAGVIGGLLIVPIAFDRREAFLKADTIVIALGIFFMGYCVIHTFISFFVEKRRPKFYRPLFVIWVVMLLLMIFSKSNFLWPECYFVLFLCYYLTPQTQEQRSNVYVGVVNGIILGFICIQTHSLLCRPYDILRYCGNFCNPNNNSVFLCFCLAALFAKILFVTREKRKRAVTVLYFLLTGACYSFICMTMCRSGYLATFVITLFFLYAYCRIRQRKVFFRTGVILVALFVTLFPVTYLAVRYVPTIHPHVVFYYQEGYSEARVHSWDERNSSKYITFEQVLKGIFGRMGDMVKDINDSGEGQKESSRSEGLLVAAADTVPFSILRADADRGHLEEETDPNKIPLLQGEDAKNGFIIRYTIYKWYITRLSLRGMPYEEQGFQLAKDYWVQSTHDIYLDYGINFGYPVMILFTVFIWWGIGRLTALGSRSGDVEKFSCLLITLVPPVFGLFELAWGAGMISTVAFYLCFREMMVD
ncbi:MAG: hypothetical protein NC427_02025 [Ruminococcus flavefaciens]|nr:hypothetical protein [Ruminococcus flavefaciens]